MTTVTLTLTLPEELAVLAGQAGLRSPLNPWFRF